MNARRLRRVLAEYESLQVTAHTGH
jgi:hypothetical protein